MLKLKLQYFGHLMQSGLTGKGPQFFPASGSFPMKFFTSAGLRYWSFSFNISASSEYSGLISFRID